MTEGDTHPPNAFSSSAATAKVRWSLYKLPITYMRQNKNEVSIKVNTFLNKTITCNPKGTPQEPRPRVT